MNKTVIFDMDDTIVNLRDYIVQQVRLQLKEDVTVDDIKTTFIQNAFPGICWDTIQRHVIDNNILSNLPPEDNTAHTIRKVKDMGYNITVITARGYHPKGHEETEQWFINNNLPFDDIFCVTHNEGKANIIKNLGHVQLYVDDHPTHIKDSLNLTNVKHNVLMNRPWNGDFNHPELKRINKIHEIMHHL